MIRVILILGIALSLLACAKEPVADTEQSPAVSIYSFRHDANLTISKAGKEIAQFQIEIAESTEDRTRGLMFREDMTATQGMLFVFKQNDYHSFWMKNTYLSLDMIFIDSAGKIVHIEQNTTPFSEENLSPDTPCLYVLEVLAGTTRKLNIEIGDTVKWKTK